jgi:hypothetical protein
VFLVLLSSFAQGFKRASLLNRATVNSLFLSRKPTDNEAKQFEQMYKEVTDKLGLSNLAQAARKKKPTLFLWGLATFVEKYAVQIHTYIEKYYLRYLEEKARKCLLCAAIVSCYAARVRCFPHRCCCFQIIVFLCSESPI